MGRCLNRTPAAPLAVPAAVQAPHLLLAPPHRGSLLCRMTMLMLSQHASQSFHIQRSRTIFNDVRIPRGLQASCGYGSCPIRVTADQPLQRDLLTAWARPLVVMAAGRRRAS